MKTDTQSVDPKKPTFKKPDMAAIAANISKQLPAGAQNDQVAKILAMGELREIDLSLVDRDEAQPRPLEEVMEGIEEFANRIEKQGFILAQHPVYHIKPDGRFQIVDGERRTTAFKLKERKKILAVVKRFTEAELDKLSILQYVANDSDLRKPLSPIADARWWRIYIDKFHGGVVGPAAAAMGKSEPDVSNRLSILRAPAYLVEIILNDRIKDPATISLLNRTNESCGEEKVQEIMTAYRDGMIKGSFRQFLENVRRETKIAKKRTAKPKDDTPSVENSKGQNGESSGAASNSEQSTLSSGLKKVARDLSKSQKNLASVALLDGKELKRDAAAVLSEIEAHVAALKALLNNQ